MKGKYIVSSLPDEISPVGIDCEQFGVSHHNEKGFDASNGNVESLGVLDEAEPICVILF